MSLTRVIHLNIVFFCEFQRGWEKVQRSKLLQMNGEMELWKKDWSMLWSR